MTFLNWRRPSIFAALAVFAAVAASPAGPASAANTCQLGANVNYAHNCASDANGDSVYEWAASDTDGDEIVNTLAMDTDDNGAPDTFYTTLGGFYGEIIVQYDSDEDGLYNTDEIGLYGTDPLRFDSDGDLYSDGFEVMTGSGPLNPYCTPYECG